MTSNQEEALDARDKQKQAPLPVSENASSTTASLGNIRLIEAKPPEKQTQLNDVPPEELKKLKSLPDYQLRNKIARRWYGKASEDDRWMSDVEWEYHTKQRLESSSNQDMQKWVLMIDEVEHTMNEKKPRLKIASPYLKKVIRDVVKFDLTLDRVSDQLSLVFPFHTLFHHWNDIETAIENDKVSSEQEKYDFEALKWFYNNHSPVNNPQDTLDCQHASIREYLKSGEIKYNDIWAVYKPGTQVVVRDSLGEWQMLMVVSCEKEEIEDIPPPFRHGPRGHQEKRPRRPLTWKVHMWQMTWVNARECFTRVSWSRTLHRFSGTRQVSNLPLLPVDYYEDKDGKLPKLQAQIQLRQSLTERGMKWAHFIRIGPTCSFYEGAAAKLLQPNAQPPPIQAGPLLPVFKLKGRVVVDQQEDFYVGDFHYITQSPYGNYLVKDVIALDGRHEYVAFDDNPREKELEPIQAMLCPAAVQCFDMGTHQSYWVPVNHLQAVPWQSDILEKLVLREGKKQELIHLVERYRTKNNEGVQDLIEGKGEGLVILLHGPPGVGKTLTAEVVAEHLRQPLQSIRLSNLLHKKGDFESDLISIFRRASRQKVILLLDEADVILEERAPEDVKRNSIVSTFLRTIEYFDGIVFLTTNRPGAIDSAFESRISFFIKYPPLDSQVRTDLWRQFLQNLEPRVESNVASVIDNLNLLKPYQLNGRQIRNVINVSAAIARATNDGVLDIDVLRKLAEEASSMFKKLKEDGEGSYRTSRYR